MTEIVGDERLFLKYEQLKALADNEQLANALFAGGLQLERQVKLNIREQRLIDTSRLINSIETQRDDKETVVFTGVKYAAIHEYGGVIRPKRESGLLTFNIDGQWVSTRQVKIPARPYFRPAIDTARAKITQGVVAVLSDAIKAIVGL